MLSLNKPKFQDLPEGRRLLLAVWWLGFEAASQGRCSGIAWLWRWWGVGVGVGVSCAGVLWAL